MTRLVPLRWRRGITALALFALVLIARWPLIDRPFSLQGEAREATCIADVVREGHWIAPYPNGDWIPTKGPLLYWWAGAAASVFGLSERVLRLSIAALNLGTLLATAWLGCLLGSARARCLAAAMLAPSFLLSGYAFLSSCRSGPRAVYDDGARLVRVGTRASGAETCRLPGEPCSARRSAAGEGAAGPLADAAADRGPPRLAARRRRAAQLRLLGAPGRRGCSRKVRRLAERRRRRGGSGVRPVALG